MTKTYILTGGPGTGKSSLILALEQRGEYTIREAAEDHIKLRQANGIKEPWTEPDFQDLILDLQLKREKRIPAGTERAFIDRGLPDGLAYAKEGTATYERIFSESRNKNYTTIFLVETLGTTEKTETRRENHEEATKLGNKLEKIYTQLGYKPIRIKTGTLQERLEEILNNL